MVGGEVKKFGLDEFVMSRDSGVNGFSRCREVGLSEGGVV